MKNLHHLLLEITTLTTKIETNYPELYRSLDENPMTLANSSHPHVDREAMEEYLESLKQLLRHHVETHKN
ncbi:hypothetical protein CW736_08440 [Nonlabens sp. MB-3u-79]|uniref:hypothetical protein n=1 Tax=Nonlabens sp. MB-3u-79 TaxID=2058134 RepID=UPI000C316641|nr:hypothetical protein [Nonlabens sp. MB-3u-79]AUC79402.1 hypothetical protein CW736_08440 [Nonlabens sp. MB-3u-79]|tara:strand:- start:428 stop:637 length:210 start_codon:yes stop_codon:yes gene_type:complete